MLLIFLIPLIGLLLAALLNRFFPKTHFRGYNILPFFFITACSLITSYQKKPSFLPYGFLIYFILVIIVAINNAIKYKNISLGKIFGELWDYLTACSMLWYLGLILMVIL
ncbi:DUF3397 family protein [Lactobacillus sp. ESL0791]|uniref:DUF3397 family protein n=1 Tax=Lactobacillus sp. ESL0791 TaxID=2983234 RepID=UPI0023F8C5AA|nr:DUF3397 family protein [Lactobacillus sp. ESL0791]MDF7638801.1 DUF3397 family protein [Lactobacillus sp. ESL0791]